MHAIEAKSVRVTASVEPKRDIATDDVRAMYQLYATHYRDTSVVKFESDLQSKTHVLLLRDERDKIVGFSTLDIYLSCAGVTPCKVVYSGDTIIEPEYWGNSALAFKWLRHMGSVWAEDENLPLYWLLIVKGHRTYRFLETFAREYVPHYKKEASNFDLLLRNALAIEKFGTCYCPNTGIAKFGANSGRLSEELALVPDSHRKRPAVDYFLKQNPGYARGDELVCLCRLSPENLKPLARRTFLPRGDALSKPNARDTAVAQ